MLLALRAVGGIGAGLLIARFVHTGPAACGRSLPVAFVAAGSGLQPLFGHWASVGLLMFALGVGSGLMTVYFQVTLAALVKPEMRGSAMALGGVGWGVSHMTTPLVMGLMADRYGIPSGFYVLGVVALGVVGLVAVRATGPLPALGWPWVLLHETLHPRPVADHQRPQPRAAIEETLELARRADALGYHRYWLAEHHAIAALADPCPEILLARAGRRDHAHPRRYRRRAAPLLQRLQGGGGIPNARGAVPGTHRSGHRPRARRRPAYRARAMDGGSIAGAGAFPQQVQELIGYLDGTLPADHPFTKVSGSPQATDAAGALAARLLRLQRPLAA